MQAGTTSYPEWPDAAAYAPLFEADRSLVAWEWLRRDPAYRLAAAGRFGAAKKNAAEFGLVAFEPAEIGVPLARPLWLSETYPFVLRVRRALRSPGPGCFDLERLCRFERIIADDRAEHLLLSDGFRSIRLDAPPGTFKKGPVALSYSLGGLSLAEPQLLTLRRFLMLCRSGRFSRDLHPREPRARRWVLMLRAFDAIAAGADQRHIAQVLLSRSASEPCWRSREPSIRSQAQRLVHCAKAFGAGGYRQLLR